MRVFFCECSLASWLDIAERLVVDRGWEVPYWTAGAHHLPADDVRRRLPGVVFHDSFDAIRGVAPPELADMGRAGIDQELLRDLAYDESLVLKMMDRMDPGGAFSHGERVALYHEYLGYWQAVLDRFRPDAVVMPVAPHLMYDYVLYALCRRRGIQTLMFIETIWADLMLPVHRFEEGAVGLLDAYRRALAAGCPPASLSPQREAYWSRATAGDYAQSIPFFMKSLLETLPRHHGVLGALHARLRRLTRPDRIGYYLQTLWRMLFISQATRNYQKRRGRHVTEAPRRGLSFLWMRARSKRRQRRLYAEYERLAAPVDLDVPYVFVALNFGPERTVSPEGGQFVHQHLIIELLDAVLPPSWRIYVKEHPSQFVPGTWGDQGRAPGFYRRLKALTRVDLVSISRTSFELIDRSRAVVTISGSAGWEAVVRGKPALLFGYPWYRGCEGAFSIDSRRDLEAAVARIVDGYRPDPHAVRLYIQAVEQYGVYGYVDPNSIVPSSISPERNTAAMTAALVRFLERHHRQPADAHAALQVADT